MTPSEIKNWEDKTVKEAKDYLRVEANGKGETCPCCTQFVKVYKRPLNSSMCKALILIYKHSVNGADFIHVEKMLKEESCEASVRGDFPKLRFWGFLEPMEEAREDESCRNGMYKITENGRLFVEEMIIAPTYVKVFNNRYMGSSKEMTTISKAIKNKFDYKQLMQK
jgi:hypothetical protein